MLELVPHEFEVHAVRTACSDEGQVLFIFADICRALGILNPRDAIEQLDADEKTKVPRGEVTVANSYGKNVRELKGKDLWLVNESGLYHLIFKSRKAAAQRFRKWVTGEVLPTLRRTGAYSLGPAPLSQEDIEAGWRERECALFSRWRTGQRLKGDELREIIHLTPPLQVANAAPAEVGQLRDLRCLLGSLEVKRWYAFGELAEICLREGLFREATDTSPERAWRPALGKLLGKHLGPIIRLDDGRAVVLGARGAKHRRYRVTVRLEGVRV